jgi:aspartate carbamoyltransferase catalytic subunit
MTVLGIFENDVPKTLIILFFEAFTRNDVSFSVDIIVFSIGTIPLLFIS